MEEDINDFKSDAYSEWEPFELNFSKTTPEAKNQD